MKASRTIFLMMGFGLTSCGAASSQVLSVRQGLCGGRAGLVDQGANDAAQRSGAKVVTFYGDLLPILTDAKTGEVHKCTTCHAQYATPIGLNSEYELTRVVNAMQSGYMPRGGNAVPQVQIDLFQMWALQGFEPGESRTSEDAVARGTGACATNTSP